MLLSALWSLLAMCRQFPVSRGVGAPAHCQGYIRQLPPPIPLSVPCAGACSVQGTTRGPIKGPPPAGVLATELRAADGATRSCPVFRLATRAEGPFSFSLELGSLCF